MPSKARGSVPTEAIEHWIEAARTGGTEELGQLFEACRPYLLRVANKQIEPDLKPKVGVSDLVQETFLEAQLAFGRFDGTTEAELLAWLVRILLNNAVSAGRQFHGTEKRRLDREVALPESALAHLLNAVADPGESPSAMARAHEQHEMLQRALLRLPKQYQDVIRWRNYERCSFEEVGRRLERSPEAARKLWARALVHLQQMLEFRDESR